MQRHPTKLARDSHTPQILKVQMGLAGLGGIFLGLAKITHHLKWIYFAVGSWAALLSSGLPLYQKIWQRDRPVLVLAPWLLFVRAWALGLGFLWGFIRLVLLKQLKSDY